MADVFISYSSQDRALAQQLADRLAVQGHSVWWDVSLVPGDSFRPAILAELENAKRVFVIWTPNSVKSEWVISEADRAAKMNKLVAVRIPGLDLHDIPPPFDQRHTILLESVLGANANAVGSAVKHAKAADPLARGLIKAWLTIMAMWGLVGTIANWDAMTSYGLLNFLEVVRGYAMGGGLLFCIGAIFYFVFRGFRPHRSGLRT